MAKGFVTPVYRLICAHKTQKFCLTDAYLTADSPDRLLVQGVIEDARFHQKLDLWRKQKGRTAGGELVSSL
jgi:hypothetical protein